MRSQLRTAFLVLLAIAALGALALPPAGANEQVSVTSQH
ncbi:hypothetical protein SAMN04489726_5610 [Allokutzneria albata]|uniref:Uncharacterized protein n=1 Tax=Allokutzneria albata TaxID=211114 RepID=A0A1G9ZNB2_ALLAB|nr:hypothetical protein SAMN04489726_5610 [Allokutzneria albata]